MWFNPTGNRKLESNPTTGIKHWLSWQRHGSGASIFTWTKWIACAWLRMMVMVTKAAPGILVVWMKPREIARCTGSWCNKCNRNWCDGHVHILCPVKWPQRLMYDRVICHVGHGTYLLQSLLHCALLLPLLLLWCYDAILFPLSFIFSSLSSSCSSHFPLASTLYTLLPLVGLLLSLVSPRWLVMPLLCFVCLLARGWH